MSEERTLKPVSPARLRRGLGIIFILVGGFYCATMVFATMAAMGKLRGTPVPPQAWGLLYRANFFFMNIGGLGFLALTLALEGIFFFQTLIDFVIGESIYFALVYLSAVLLVRGLIPDWMSVIPGLALIWYGEGLRRGRRLWRESRP